MTEVVLARRFFARDPLVVAPELLGKVLVVGDRAARIVEVEAYRGADDPASHTFGGRTPRNATMFGPPGHLYVYRSYGVHWCANVVCDVEGVGSAVLLRAGVPVRGLEAMWAARPAARRLVDLASGPGKLCQALGLVGDHDGTDLTAGAVELVDDGTPPPVEPVATVRVGISRAVDRPWRWYVPDEPHVSHPRPRPRRPGPVGAPADAGTHAARRAVPAGGGAGPASTGPDPRGPG